MADENDTAVDTAIKKVQAALDELVAAQRKDDAGEDEPKDLAGAEKKAHRVIAARKAAADAKSE